MKSFVILVLMVVGGTLATVAQPTSTFKHTPSFSSIVVSNVDTSAEWYKKVLGFTSSKQMNDEKSGTRIVILESPSFKLELLELSGSLVRKDLLQSKKEGTQIQGHFKIGFNTDIDAFLKHLADLKMDVPQVWNNSVTNKRNFLISDPDGNLIQFFE